MNDPVVSTCFTIHMISELINGQESKMRWCGFKSRHMQVFDNAVQFIQATSVPGGHVPGRVHQCSLEGQVELRGTNTRSNLFTDAITIFRLSGYIQFTGVCESCQGCLAAALVYVESVTHVVNKCSHR